MKKLFIVLMLFVGITGRAAAQRNANAKVSDANATSVKADALKITDSNKEEEMPVDGKDILLSGNNNKITFKGTVGKIVITGKDNDIYISSVEQIIVTGNGNFVSWEKSPNSNGKPYTLDRGGYNNIEKRSSDAIDRSDN